MRDITDLREYQLDAARFLMARDGANLYCDVGSGKTIATLTALVEADIWPVLIVAPLRVAQTVWHEEILSWAHTAHLTYSQVLGNRRQRERALAQRSQVYIINYENLPWLCQQLAWKQGDFKVIVWDEISKMKTRGARWKAVKRGARQIPWRIGLTGTPRGNSFLGIWSQAHLVDVDDLLGRSFTAFRQKYFYPTDYNQYNWAPFPGAEQSMGDLLARFSYRLDPSQYKMPDPIENEIGIELPGNLDEVYENFEKTLVLDDIEAANAAVLVNKLRQMASGSVYDEDGKPVQYHTLKLEALQDLVEELSGEPLLVFYEFEFQKDQILATFDQAHEINPQTMDQWNKGKIQMLVAHPQSAGHGLSLQSGGHHMVFMSEPWSSELVQQAVGRLNRSGQKNQVYVHRIVSRGTVDDTVHAALGEHYSQEQYVLDLIQQYRGEK